MSTTLLLADLTGLLPIVLLASAVIGVLAVASRPKSVFEISIVDGAPVVSSGQPPVAFVQDVQRICAMWRIDSGVVRGVESGSKVEVIVKGNAAEHAQAFLNAWRNPI